MELEDTGRTSEILVIDEILQIDSVKKLVRAHSKSLVIDAINTVLDEVKQAAMEMDEEERKEKGALLKPSDLVPLIAELVERLAATSTKRVINATGEVSSHLLGQPCLSPESLVGLAGTATGYSNSEFDLETGKRRPYAEYAERILCNLTKCEAAAVTTSGGAALFLVLKVLAEEKSVVVSRQELVEIGESFRIPNIIAESRACVKAVGTVNKTYVKDYLDAISSEVAILLKVRASCVGGEESVSEQDLARFAGEHSIPFVEYLDYGALIDLSRQGYCPGLTASDCLTSGADVVVFEGQKLLGSPQAGVILGKKKYVLKIKRHPLTQALRTDRLTLAGLEANLESYLDPEQVVAKVPVFSMLAASLTTLRARAFELAKRLEEKLGSSFQIEVEEKRPEGVSDVSPKESPSTYVVTVKVDNAPVTDILTTLRRFSPPVIAKTEGDKIILDMRTIRPEEIGEVASSFNSFV